MDNYILIVEDDEAVADLYKIRLELAGYNVEVQTNGIDAMKRVRVGIPQLMLLDIMMPGMNGLELLYRLRKNAATRSVPVVILSALYEKRLGDLPGVVRHMVKGSFTLEDLIATVKSAIGTPLEARAALMQ